MGVKAQEKAKELIKKFSPLVTTWDCYHDGPRDEIEITKDAAKCAIVAIDEMIIQNGELYLKGFVRDYYNKKNAFLFQVKKELESYEKL